MSASSRQSPGSVGKAKVIAVCLTVMLTFGIVSAACNNSGKPSAQAKRAAQAKAKAHHAARAKQARAAAARRRRLVAQRRAARRATALARAQAQQPATSVPTSVPTATPTTTIPPVATATPTTVTPETVTPAADLAAIEQTFTRLNAAFHKSVTEGIVASVYSNYWVATRHYTAAQCTQFEANRGGGVVAEAFAVNPKTFTPDPGWVDPAVGTTPTGRIYSLAVDDTQTLVTTGATHTQSAVMHATVIAGGTAFLFFRCT